MDTFTYKGISDGKYVEGNIEALNSDEASHKLKEQKIIITNLIRAAKGKKKEEKGSKKKASFALFGKKLESASVCRPFNQTHERQEQPHEIAHGLQYRREVAKPWGHGQC